MNANGNERAGKGAFLETTLDLPASWAALLAIEELGEDVTSGDHDKNAADPRPYYDDNRAVAARFADGAVVTAFLCSGQTNYWLSFDIWRDRDCVTESEPMHEVAAGDVWEWGCYRARIVLTPTESWMDAQAAA